MKSNGPLQTVAEIKRLAREIRDGWPNDRRKQDMAALASRNPHAFLARPAWQEDLVTAAGYELD